MSLRLPKSCLQISAIPSPSSQVKLIKRRVYWNSPGLSMRLPNSLLRGMKILSDGFLNSVPISHSFGQIKAQTIIWQRECYSSKREQISCMHRTMHIIVYSRNNRDLKMVSGKYLGWLININVSFFIVLFYVVLYLVEIDIRGPTIDIDYCQE